MPSLHGRTSTLMTIRFVVHDQPPGCSTRGGAGIEQRSFSISSYSRRPLAMVTGQNGSVPSGWKAAPESSCETWLVSAGAKSLVSVAAWLTTGTVEFSWAGGSLAGAVQPNVA